MTAAETLIPASRIMRERDEWKAAWAAELTRAEALERELAEARSQSIDDLTDHCAAQGRYIEQLQKDVAFWKDSSAEWARLREVSDERIKQLETQIEHWKDSHQHLYAKWFALSGTPYGLRAVVAEAGNVNRDRKIAALQAELKDLKGALEQYESDAEDAR